VAIGGGALISTYWVPRPLVVWDLPWETLTDAALWAYLWFRGGRIGRMGSIYFVTMYIAYILFRVLFFSVN
jgi:cation:H+ antiporter